MSETTKRGHPKHSEAPSGIAAQMKALIRRAKETPAPAQVPEACAKVPWPLAAPPPVAIHPGIRLCEQFLDAAAEEGLLALLRRELYVPLRGRKTARFGGEVGPDFVAEALPPYLREVCDLVTQVAQLTPANHVLVNHYQAGQGILPHTDGPAYTPYAAILSLNSAVVFDFWRDHQHAASGQGPISLLLPARSLLVFEGEAYWGLHGLADRHSDSLEGVLNPEMSQSCKEQLQVDGSLRRQERFSLTIRHVTEKVQDI